MRVPKRLEPLLEQGTIEEVLRPLMSGKEAEVYLVRSEGEVRVAKVYKDAQFRSFQHRAEYTEGRRVRSSREQRAINKGSRYGKARTEDAWYDAEVVAIQRARAAGIRVPMPYDFVEGVLVMELVRGADGEPAPRLVDTDFTAEEATQVFDVLLREVIKMLCIGIVHADLSDFNVLMAADGPVIIDFPQAVDPANNQNARKLLIRDVKNITSFLGRHAPDLRKTQYGPEMWDLYERSELDADTELTGVFKSSAKEADVSGLLEEIMLVEEEARERREALGLPEPRRARRPIPRAQPQEQPAPARGRRWVEEPPQAQAPKQGQRAQAPQRPTEQAEGADGSKPKRKRRRRRRGGEAGDQRRDAGQQQGGAGRSAGGQGPRTSGPGGGPRDGGSRNVKEPAKPQAEGDSPPKKRRRRRRRRSGGANSGDGPKKD
jgi:RIO kinase 1